MTLTTIKWDTSTPSFTEFSKTLRELQHPVPWHACEEEYGTILDANGDPVAVIDPHNERHDDETAYQLAIWIVTAVNTCAGFRAVIQGH